MSKFLFVPIHLDALFLLKNRQVVSAKADFTKLPYSEKSGDINSNTPPISEAILSQEFENLNLTLKAGIHLHWSLPDALTHGTYIKQTDEIVHYAVPNRWLVTRRKRDRSIAKQWVVESDYVYQGDEPKDNKYGAIAYPIDILKQGGTRPFCYLGRQLSASGWKENTTASYLGNLTAVGYGEPTFAAFYPNCHSVFGCYDDGIVTAEALAGLSYNVIGWYSDSRQEPIKQYQELLKAQELAQEGSPSNFLKDFAWRLPNKKTLDSEPERCFCYAKLEFNAQSLDLNSSSAGTTVTLANSPSEAFSASMAYQMSQEKLHPNKQKIEEQLEALLLFKKLSNNNSDRYALFHESFHENGFTAINGGSIWRVTATNTTPKDSATQDKTADASKEAREITLPKQISHYLNQCNLAQQRVYAHEQSLISLRQQLFSDWYKYTLSAYPEDDGQNDPPDVDEIKLYIEARRLRELDRGFKKGNFLRSQLQEKYTQLNQALELINNGHIPAQVLFQRFDSSDAAPDDAKSFLVDNRPFNPTCLAGNGVDFSRPIHPPSSIQGISLWVNIAGKQEGETCLLNLVAAQPELVDAMVSPQRIGGIWRYMYINGKKQDPYLPLDWLDIPKDSWTHIYLEMDRLLSVTIHLFSNGEQASYCKAKLAGVRCFSAPLSEDEIFADRNMFQQRQYKLQQKVAPRYWQPNEPYVLLQGETIKPSERHGSDGRLSEDGTLLCHVVDDEGINRNSLAGAKWARSQIQNIAKPGQIGYSTWDAQPWHPFMLEWQAEVFPLAKHNNLNASTGGQYHPDFLKSHFDLRENQPDLAAKANNRVVKAASIYRGSVILTPHAQQNLIQSFEDLLDNLTPADCYQVYKEIKEKDLADYDHKLKNWFANKLNLKKAIADWRDQKPSDEQKMESWLAQKPTFKKHISQFQCWYENKPVFLDASGRKHFKDLDDQDRLENAIYVAILALKKTYRGGMNCLSQSLGGFNAALLAHKQTMQIPISEPLGFDAYKTFTARIRDYVDKESKVAPQPDNDFLPIRSGTMNLLRLTLVDTFGLVASDLDVLNLITPEKNHVREPRLKGDPERDHFLLSPAFVQPTRLNFRWLSAANGDQEMNDHPASSPICGWLLPNNLDGSVMVYDQAGDLLGLVNQGAQWASGPGNDITLAMEDIGNPYLRQVVQGLTGNTNFLKDFITVIDQALEDIDPENFAAHQDLALLMGRPIAVTRASLQLEVQGELAVNQSWNVFRRDLRRINRDTDKFEQVTVPIRVGERGQLNDGVIGFWKEDQAYALQPEFHTTVAEADVTVTASNIKFYEQGLSTIEQSLASPPQTITLLVDPRAKVHATCGVLPAKTIDIPSDQYRDAIEQLKITFLSTPLFTEQGKINLPLPDEGGYRWSWLQKERFHWHEIARTGTINKDKLIQTFEEGSRLWDELLSLGWLKETSTGKAKIVPQNQRKSKDLSPRFAKIEDRIEEVLEQGYINPIETQAVFAGKSEFREGWLQLSPDK